MPSSQYPLRFAFLALPLEGSAKWQFQALQEELRPWVDILSFQNPQSPHLTLRFWKELSPIEHKQIMEQAEKIAAQTSPFSLQIHGAETFGKRGEERVLFLTVAFSPELADLKKRCPWPNEPGKEFHPHITLARIRHPQKFTVHRKNIFKALGNINIPASFDRLRFYAEIDGRKQTPLQDFLFAGQSSSAF